MPSEVIDRALSGHLTVTASGDQRRVDHFVEFHAGAASFPWRSQAKWIAHRLRQSHHPDSNVPLDVAARVFRSDLHRRHLENTGADLPGASEKLEGAIRHETAVASMKGGISLLPDAFFDGRIFDPSGIK